MIVSAIVAKGENNIIGRDNDLPWHLPGDLKWFKAKTLNRHIIMGRTSFECLPKPLPKRVNIVVTRDKSYFHSGVEVFHSIEAALKFAYDEGEDEAFILGGGKVYDQTKELWDRLYLTEVAASPEGDTKFPELDYDKFELSFEEAHQQDEKNDHDYTFKIFNRVR